MSVKKYLSLFILLLFTSSLWAQYNYVLTPRDTGPAPQPYNGNLTISSEYEKITETETLEVFFRDDRDVMAIRDKRNGYVWKTGLDIPFSRDLDDLIDEGADPDSLPPKEERLNTTYTGIANSLVSIEYFDGSNNTKRIASAAYKDSESEFSIISSSPFKAKLEVEFKKIDIAFVLQIKIEEDQLIFSIDNNSLEGDDLARLSFINLAPFMGASGGKELFWDKTEEEHSISKEKTAPDGYAVVPDGPGALIRFLDNNTKLSTYIGDVYGRDMSQLGIIRDFDDFSVEPKRSTIPLYGMVHGNNQNAFAAYASKAGEFLEVVSIPEEHTTFYSQTYGRFVYNRLYYQVYNKNGDGYYRTLEEANQFDFEFRIQFLQGEEADYGGIAGAYRDYLQTSDSLPAPAVEEGDIPLRIDFLMADVRDNIVGKSHEVTTTIEDVKEILLDLQSQGIENISTGLIGYANGGTVFSDPGKVELLRALGSKREFKRIIEELQLEGMDISLSRNYDLIADGQILPWGNAVRGVSGWYLEKRTFQANAPVNLFYYSRPEKAVQWIEDENKAMARLGLQSQTIGGITEVLISDYSSRETLNVSETIELYRDLMEQLGKTTKLNLVNPNQYLWKYADSYLQMPLFSTQYLIETDTVPLLQMILQGSMDLYARYANYSFSSQRDILRMIDYNVYPSFLITQESAHLLLATSSSENYSSQYSIYRDLIKDVYEKINHALREVKGARWLDRTILEPGVVLNTYDNGKAILINYSMEGFRYGEHFAPPEEAVVMKWEGN